MEEKNTPRNPPENMEDSYTPRNPPKDTDTLVAILFSPVVFIVAAVMMLAILHGPHFEETGLCVFICIVAAVFFLVVFLGAHINATLGKNPNGMPRKLAIGAVVLGFAAGVAIRFTFHQEVLEVLKWLEN